MNKKLLHIIYRTDIVGGVENFISTLLKNSKNNDMLVQVYNKKNETGIKNKIINLNEKINSYNPIILLYQIIIRAIKYRNICRENEIEFSVSHGDSLNLSNIISKILFKNKSKIYIFLHNSLSFYTNSGSYFYKYIFNYFYPKADKIITISKEMAFELKKKGYKNIETIYNPINLEEIEKLKNEKIKNEKIIFDKSKKTFITIGRLEKVKNIEFLIKSFHTFNKKNKNYQFIIIGDGREKNRLKNIVEEIGNKNIKIIGREKNVYKFLKKSDFFIFSSLNEGFGRVMIEALACGIPIITHDFKYGAKEIIRNNNNFYECKKIEINENGILVPYLSKKDFVKSMELIVKNNFDKNKIKTNIEKYNIKKLEKNWNLILK